ncbi:MAG: hypothetical protein ISS33_00115 [Candidatus Omnitrophica bacterium]|nr:hypothetical protein [Candidatus Omnitrophota bacterium]
MVKREITKCPSCLDAIEIEDEVELGDIIYCLNCEAELEVVGVDPVVRLREIEESEEEEENFDFHDFYGDDERDRWGE